MKKKLSKLLTVLLGVLMLAVCIPASAFAEDFSDYDGWITINQHFWFPSDDYLSNVDNVMDGVFIMDERYTNLDATAKIQDKYYLLDKYYDMILPPAWALHEGDFNDIWVWSNGDPTVDPDTYKTYAPGQVIVRTDLTRSDGHYHVDLYALIPGLYPEDIRKAFEEYKNGTTEPTPNPEEPTVTPNPGEEPSNEPSAPSVTPAPSTTPAAASSADSAPVFVDTRTAQQKEIDEAKANGTWGIEYTTCLKCGYHNWTRQGNVYVCDTCGNETTEVVGPKGVKGYVGSGAIAAMAPAKSAPETRYATAAEAQAAADQREADYAAAIAAFQKQIAAREAAYLASLGK
ncbi:hypothetical protein [uncultured Gemmiger sp.]|uniref:hypothetical protein n=1 Tax=uncultured Gemmiger sp. TaxID=1623490 RepID=UPI0025F7437E|nr:hypothetical protein [uncultured Gemmiger sp.]